ncbi:hypothetical protein GGS24DRAFT_163094 [Hypoxylon argillaceum]|nr:hypothetical protein GGS24DRAFT_163094 [Hypoxylon argillaceum]
MPTNRGSVFSETLQEITNTKLEELSKKRVEFETAKESVISHLESERDALKRLKLLSHGVKDCFAIKTTKTGEFLSGPSKSPDLEIELKNLDSFMAQSKYDSSITPQLMRSWEKSLLRRLDMQSSKLQYASLHAQLVTEWLSTEKAAAGAPEDSEVAEGYEDVGDAMKKEARREWEQVVFKSVGVSRKTLMTYLVDLFGLQDENRTAKTEALEQLREKLTAFENTLTAQKQFSPATLTWVINGLLVSDVLTDERREVLRDFLGNPTILVEVADVLNMRLAALSTWSWGESVCVEQQQKITGVYTVQMHEDVLQAIFLHYIGVKWSVFLKGAFRQFREFDGAWKSSRISIPQLDQKRRQYYLGAGSVHHHNSVYAARNNIYRKHYFMASLMDNEEQKEKFLEGEEEANSSTQNKQQDPSYLKSRLYHRISDITPMDPPLSRARGVPKDVNNKEVLVDFDFDLPANDAVDTVCDKQDRDLMEDKQRLVRLLSTEIAINTKLHGEVTAFHSVFESWEALLPHETATTVMRILGVSRTWMDFFARFLRAPLKFLGDDNAAPRIRRRGTQAAHALSGVFGECVLFCLDFAVNEATGGHPLHRLHDDLWFWSRDHGIAKTAWETVSAFAAVARTRIDPAKSGTVRISRDPSTHLAIDAAFPAGDIRWGFLKLSATTGRFEIDQAMVDKHVVDLRRQLAGRRRSVIAFVQAWNAFAATFFGANFGRAAHCLGRAHVDQMLATHRRVERAVFASPLSPLLSPEEGEEPITSVAQYLKHILRVRFGVADVPDAFLFFPLELGGLDLRSPFISVLPARDAVAAADPAALLDAFLKAERGDYERRKLAFVQQRRSGIIQQFAGVPNPGVVWDAGESRGDFPSFAEYARYREDLSYGGSSQDDLASVFRRLLQVPAATEGGIREASAEVRAAVEALQAEGRRLAVPGYPGQQRGGITGGWHEIEPYWRWVAQLHGPEAIARFGGLHIVEPGLLPMGMVRIFRDERVKWQG